MLTQDTTRIRRLGPARALAAIGVVFAATLAAVGSMGILGAAAAAARGSAVHAARTLNATDTAHLHYNKEVGSQLLDEGPATGGLPGKVSVRFNVGASSVSASFTIYAKGGSLTGHGSGSLHGVGVTVSFGGTMTVTGGTGRYAHAHGHGGFYGVINRGNYAATIQTTGTLTY
jgi:hypothetical protein